MTDGRRYQANHRAALTECEARLAARDMLIDELRAECERLRADAFTLSLSELQHGLNCLSVDNAMDRPDFQLAWDIYEAAKQCATPPPEPESEPPTRDKPKWDPKRLSGNRMLRNPEDAARDVSNFAAPHTPEQAHGDALAENDKALYHLGFLLRSSNADHQSLRRCDEMIRPYLTASGVPYGWKLVPVEPTDNMLAQLITSTGTEQARREPITIMRSNYRRMIAAAPQRGGE